MNGFEIQCLPGAAEPIMEVFSQSSGTAYPEEWFFEALGGGVSDAGVRVNSVTALSHGPVWQAVNILAGDVGQLPLHVMQVKGRNREKFRAHPVEWLFNSEPNATQTPAIWKETMMAWALLWGNACCYIERDGSGRPIGLLPLLPDRTEPRAVDYNTGSGEQFEFVIIESWINGKLEKFLYEDIYHVRGLATDGFWGLSAVQVCKNAIGHGMALEKHGNKLFSNGAMPSGVLEHPAKLSPEARKNIRDEWYAVHGGLSNAQKIALLMEGMKFSPISMSSRDSQWMEDRKFDREMVASLFNLPAFKLNALENSAVRANLEEQNRDYFNTSLSRHLNKFREEAERKLLTYNERRSGRVFLRWYPEAFLRGDTKSRFEAYGIAITHRFMSPNEVREKEDMNPYDGGDEFLNPAIEQTDRGESSGESDPTVDDQQRTLARRFVTSQVASLLDSEAKALEQSVGGNPQKNFCNWAAKYYENYWKMAEPVLKFPELIAIQAGFSAANWRKAVELHAQDGLQAVLAIADRVTASGLAALVTERAGEVRAMRESFAASILGEIGNAQ